MYLKEVLIGAADKGYLCKISREAFGREEFGSIPAAKKAAMIHVDALLRRQTEGGVPVRASLKERRKAYRESLPVA